MSVVFERNGFHYIPTSRTTENGEKRILSLVVKMKDRSSVEYPKLSVWEYSEDEYVNYINSHKVEDATVILDDFSFLTRCPGLKYLALWPSCQAPKNVSYVPVYQLPNLMMLEPHTVYGYGDRRSTTFDCAKMVSKDTIQSFDSDSKGVMNLDALTRLRSLSISNYQGRDLCSQIGSPVLDSLYLLLCRKLESLNGIEASGALKAVRISDCYQLNNIDALYTCRETMTGLIIDNCKCIQDYSVLGSLRQLTRLSLLGSGSISSLSFIKNLPNLKSLTLSVNVLDGDLSVCDHLEHVSFFPNKRHYNRKDEDFPKKHRHEFVFGDESIEEWRRTTLR